MYRGSILHRRGRCRHRPAANARFMVVFRRIGFDFPFRSVGVDAHIDPPETPVLWWFSGEYVKLRFHVVGADDPVRPRKRAVLRKSDANPQHFEGPMWASAPTNNHENSTNFEGGQSRPPLQMKIDRPFVASIFIRQMFACTAIFPAQELSGFAKAGRIREVYILRRRGRCLHRPTLQNENTPA